MIFGALLVAWVVTNSFILYARGAFDPYPYILLNLFLSMLAALQAPVIMMSQDRQAAKDRMDVLVPLKRPPQCPALGSCQLPSVEPCRYERGAAPRLAQCRDP